MPFLTFFCEVSVGISLNGLRSGPSSPGSCPSRCHPPTPVGCLVPSGGRTGSRNSSGVRSGQQAPTPYPLRRGRAGPRVHIPLPPCPPILGEEAALWEPGWPLPPPGPIHTGQVLALALKGRKMADAMKRDASVTKVIPEGTAGPISTPSLSRQGVGLGRVVSSPP